MNVVFRADASLQIGTGHVMRCLALAGALRAEGAFSSFICRQHPGNLVELVRERGFPVHTLAAGDPEFRPGASDPALPAHSAWLGVDMLRDARECAGILEEAAPDWLVVDHYALDLRWERHLHGYSHRMMVVDDLADRPHDCDFLLDQNLGRREEHYGGLVPERCRLAVGTRYALLRPEFAERRDESLSRRQHPRLQRILVTMGGVDRDNATARVLDALARAPLPAGVEVRVVMGAGAPWLSEIRELAHAMPWPCRVDAGVGDMARLMSESDLVIGAAGSTSWERCCLGLPSLIVVLAENQRSSASALASARAAVAIDLDALAEGMRTFFSSGELAVTMKELATAAASLVDGRGAGRVAQLMRSIT